MKLKHCDARVARLVLGQEPYSSRVRLKALDFSLTIMLSVIFLVIVALGFALWEVG